MPSRGQVKPLEQPVEVVDDAGVVAVDVDPRLARIDQDTDRCAVGLDVGARAGIEIDNLEFCLEALLGSAPFGSGRPEISRLAGEELSVTYVEVEDDGGS